MILSFHPCFLGDMLVIFGDGTLDSHDLGHIQAAKAIILPQSCTLDLYRACKSSSAQLFPNYDVRFEYPGKIGQSLLFKELKMPHPVTMEWPSVKAFREGYESEVDAPHPIPFLIKGNETHEAEGIYPITDRLTLESSLDDLQRMEGRGTQGFISQEMIPTKGNVLRVVIIGSKRITYWKRAEKPGQLITTISRGARIDRKWRGDLQEKGSIEAERLVTAAGIDLAAIDLIFDLTRTDPQPLFLEVNYVFGRRGLGGSMRFYELLSEALREWLVEKCSNPQAVTLL